MSKWTKRWKKWVAPSRLPGIWKLKEGGYLARARVNDARTGKQRELKRLMPEATEREAYDWLVEEKKRVKEEFCARPQQKLFAVYAMEIYEGRVRSGEIKSAVTMETWKRSLIHLIEGTTTEDETKHVSGFGNLFVEEVSFTHVRKWKEEIGELIEEGHFSPNTTNTWLQKLRTVMRCAAREYKLPHAATDGVTQFDTSNHVTYSEEDPNSLTAGQVQEFLETLRALYPQHYAMTYLGFVTGLRPSSLRPLRRRGSNVDVHWEDNRILIRRSQTRGDKVLDRTKQKTRYSITLPKQAMDVLAWHVRTQLHGPEQQESDLLFPSDTGGFRSNTVLNKPYKRVCEAMGLGFVLTQKGLRRSFNDVAREAQMDDLITRSISGHKTEKMQEHYSTVRGAEQQESLARFLSCVEVKGEALAKEKEAEQQAMVEAADRLHSTPVGRQSGAQSGARPPEHHQNQESRRVGLPLSG